VHVNLLRTKNGDKAAACSYSLKDSRNDIYSLQMTLMLSRACESLTDPFAYASTCLFARCDYDKDS
jgi:hypothetical protein